jgi:predicted N-acetyltransferase YhbS
MIRILEENAADAAAREALLDAAFGDARFGKTCERLREDRMPAQGLALVAKDGDRVIGTLRFWHIEAGPGRSALLLGPLAVAAGYRSAGIGRQLMRVGLAKAAMLDHDVVLLVGDAAYYGRFGFEPRFTERLWLPGAYEAERFLGLELKPGALRGAAGLVAATGDRMEKPDLLALIARETTRVPTQLAA